MLVHADPKGQVRGFGRDMNTPPKHPMELEIVLTPRALLLSGAIATGAAALISAPFYYWSVRRQVDIEALAVSSTGDAVGSVFWHDNKDDMQGSNSKEDSTAEWRNGSAQRQARNDAMNADGDSPKSAIAFSSLSWKSQLSVIWRKMQLQVKETMRDGLLSTAYGSISLRLIGIIPMALCKYALHTSLLAFVWTEDHDLPSDSGHTTTPLTTRLFTRLLSHVLIECAFYPLQLMTTRLMVSGLNSFPSWQSPTDISSAIILTSPLGLFDGVDAHALAVAVAIGLDGLTLALGIGLHGSSSSSSSFLSFLSSLFALISVAGWEMIRSLVVYPLSLMAHRQQVEGSIGASNQPEKYVPRPRPLLMDMAKDIWREDGIWGFYKGYAWQAMGDASWGVVHVLVVTLCYSLILWPQL
jgi:hypothetical protein